LLLIPTTKAPPEKIPFDIKAALLRPWKNSWHLLKTRPDFTRYQIGFMLGGGGLMLMQPALPDFFIKELSLSYTALAAAIATCKGIGFALTSNIWARWMDRLRIYRLSALVTLLAALFPLLLLFSQVQIAWVYIAYLIYGVMQAGSELSWHLSGPLFAKQEDSSAYSSVNVVTVGFRGLFAPICGSLLCTNFNPTAALLMGAVLCGLASVQLITAHGRSVKNLEINN
jgi:predicted MFS family arabinose efflux permease